MNLRTLQLRLEIASLATSLRSKTMRPFVSRLTLLLYPFDHSFCSCQSCASFTHSPAVSHALCRGQQVCSVGTKHEPGHRESEARPHVPSLSLPPLS